MPSDLDGPTPLLAAMAEGIGELSFASPEWVDAARAVLAKAASDLAQSGQDPGRFTICEVGHNPPAYLRAGAKVAWYAHIDGTTIHVENSELPADACDFKVEGDHSILSNMARIQYRDRDPDLVATAQARLNKLSRWKLHGRIPDRPALKVLLASLHDSMAIQTLPRLVFMTPEWASLARHILTARAALPKYAGGIAGLTYTFSEEFTGTPHYAFPDGAHGGVAGHRGEQFVAARGQRLGGAEFAQVGEHAARKRRQVAAGQRGWHRPNRERCGRGDPDLKA